LLDEVIRRYGGKRAGVLTGNGAKGFCPLQELVGRSQRTIRQRAMRNLIESSVRNQSTRLVNSGQCDRDALTTLLPEDLPADFESGMPAPMEIKPISSKIAPKDE
jgi:hypothetical protein